VAEDIGWSHTHVWTVVDRLLHAADGTAVETCLF
jgi:molybdenum-dependent DNA-binding transcriptional regulator ModE|tara:strand:- start:299 stop:400 length:102 start_codon:yes stop_codon:yes gene_type:complete